MKIIGKFKILDSFKVTRRGLVARGNIVEGKVKVGSFIKPKIDSDNITLEIRSVEFIDKISTGESWVGLLFVYNDENHLQELENTKLEEQFVDVFVKD